MDRTNWLAPIEVVKHHRANLSVAIERYMGELQQAKGDVARLEEVLRADSLRLMEYDKFINDHLDLGQS